MVFIRAVLAQCEIAVSCGSVAPCAREVLLGHLSLGTGRLASGEAKTLPGTGLWNILSGKKSNPIIFRTKHIISFSHLGFPSVIFFVPLPSIGVKADRSLTSYTVLNNGAQSSHIPLCINQPIFQGGRKQCFKAKMTVWDAHKIIYWSKFGTLDK